MGDEEVRCNKVKCYGISTLMDKVFDFLGLKSKNPFLNLVALVINISLLFGIIYLVAQVLLWLGFNWNAYSEFEGEPPGI